MRFYAMSILLRMIAPKFVLGQNVQPSIIKSEVEDLNKICWSLLAEEFLFANNFVIASKRFYYEPRTFSGSQHVLRRYSSTAASKLASFSVRSDFDTDGCTNTIW